MTRAQIAYQTTTTLTFDENGGAGPRDPLDESEVELADDEEYEWVEVDEEAELGDEAA